jgi:hypothetical protein
LTRSSSVMFPASRSFCARSAEAPKASTTVRRTSRSWSSVAQAAAR